MLLMVQLKAKLQFVNFPDTMDARISTQGMLLRIKRFIKQIFQRNKDKCWMIIDCVIAIKSECNLD